jgi:hypothetical protein
MRNKDVKARLHQKPRQPRFISFEDDLIRDVASIDDTYSEVEIKHVYNALIRGIKRKAKRDECFTIATPLGEFYLRSKYLEKEKDYLASNVLKGTATRGMKDKLIRFTYKLLMYKEKREEWLENWGMYFTGKKRKLYLHEQKSIGGRYPFTKQEKEEQQNDIV